jgi:hypothetical protein
VGQVGDLLTGDDVECLAGGIFQADLAAGHIDGGDRGLAETASTRLALPGAVATSVATSAA